MIHATQAHGGNQTQAAQYLAGWQRSRAELANFRKRLPQQQQDIRQQVLRQLLEPFLAVVDNLQAVVVHAPESLKNDSWAQGVVHIARQCEQLLAQYRVESIAAEGQVFNPLLHEAIGHVEDATRNSGEVVAVVQPGYRLEDQVIRPAKVTVAI